MAYYLLFRTNPICTNWLFKSSLVAIRQTRQAIPQNRSKQPFHEIYFWNHYELNNLEVVAAVCRHSKSRVYVSLYNSLKMKSYLLILPSRKCSLTCYFACILHSPGQCRIQGQAVPWTSQGAGGSLHFDVSSAPWHHKEYKKWSNMFEWYS